MSSPSGIQTNQPNLPDKPPATVNKMGLQYGLEKSNFCIKRSYRWLFEIPGVCADSTAGVDALPPEKSARPVISFKEMEIKHLIEDVYYPAKPEWKTFSVTLYDLKRSSHPVFEWLKNVYDPQQGLFYPANRSVLFQQSERFIKECTLNMYDGCGNIIERWIYEDAWPQSVNFQTLEMASSSYLTCELTIRYARAYILN